MSDADDKIYRTPHVEAYRKGYLAGRRSCTSVDTVILTRATAAKRELGLGALSRGERSASPWFTVRSESYDGHLPFEQSPSLPIALTKRPSPEAQR